MSEQKESRAKVTLTLSREALAEIVELAEGMRSRDMPPQVAAAHFIMVGAQIIAETTPEAKWKKWGAELLNLSFDALLKFKQEFSSGSGSQDPKLDA